MGESGRIVLDTAERKLSFRGRCLDVLDSCKSMCCRQWSISLTDEEFRSGIYSAIAVCSVDKSACKNIRKKCVNRIFSLVKGPDGNCVYLNEENKCSIYDIRPVVCRNFSCENGWHFSEVYPACKDELQSCRAEKGEYFFGSLHGSMKFLRNPLVRTKEISRCKNTGAIQITYRSISLCEARTLNFNYEIPALNVKKINRSLALFNGKNILDKVFLTFKKNCRQDLRKKDFFAFTRFLADNKIIVFIHHP